MDLGCTCKTACLAQAWLFGALELLLWNSYVANRDIQGRSQTCIPLCVMVSSAMGLKFWGFRVLPPTHANTVNKKQMHPGSLCALRCFTHVHLHAQTSVDASNMRTWWTTVILITGKTQIPQFEPHGKVFFLKFFAEIEVKIGYLAAILKQYKYLIFLCWNMDAISMCVYIYGVEMIQNFCGKMGFFGGSPFALMEGWCTLCS